MPLQCTSSTAAGLQRRWAARMPGFVYLAGQQVSRVKLDLVLIGVGVGYRV